MATTHIYNKLQDTSIYINLSSQNLHSAFAALKQEAKPLTTFNIKGLETKRGGERRGGTGQALGKRQKWGSGGENRDRLLSDSKTFWKGKKMKFTSVFNVNF